MSIVEIAQIEDKIIVIRGKKVLLDSVVAVLYGVETKRINEAVKNNSERFPADYLIELNKSEFANLRSDFTTSSHGGVRHLPKAFTEKGLHMLATILKSKQAVQTTFAIIETFAKVKSLQTTIAKLPDAANKAEQKSLMQKSGEIIADILDDSLATQGSETTIELNLAVLKFKHTIKKQP